MTDDSDFLRRIGALRPWWWMGNPWRYRHELEDHVRVLYDALEAERLTVVKVHYRCPRCGCVS